MSSSSSTNVVVAAARRGSSYEADTGPFSDSELVILLNGQYPNPLSEDTVLLRVCVVFPFILDVRHVYVPAEVTQDFSSTFLLRCLP